MPNEFTGEVAAAAHQRFAIVVSRYNDSITSKLLDGALATLRDSGVPDEAIDVAWVPGAWEIPVVADRWARCGRYAGRGLHGPER